MKQFIYIIFILSYLQANAQQDTIVLPLQELLDRASTQSIQAMDAERQLRTSQQDYRLFKSNLMPQLGASILAPNFFKTVRSVEQPNGSLALQSVSQHNASINLSIEQQIAQTGGRLLLQTDLQRYDDFANDQKQYSGIPLRLAYAQPLNGFNQLKWQKKMQDVQLEENARKYAIDKEAINGLAVVHYFNLLLAQSNQKAALYNQTVNTNLLKIAQERLALGNISKSELLQIQMELNSAEKGLSAAEYSVQKATTDLWAFLGQQNNTALQLAIPEAQQLPNITLEQAIAQAKKNRPDLFQMQRELLNSEMALDKAKKDYGIQADLFASFGWAGGSQQLEPVYRQAQNEQQFSLQLNIPIVDWGRKKAAVAIAQQELKFTQQAQAQRHIDFHNEIQQALELFQQLENDVKWAKSVKEIAYERFEITRQRYILSDISITELTISQREKDQAEQAYIQSLRSYWLAYYDLRRLTGINFTSLDN